MTDRYRDYSREIFRTVQALHERVTRKALEGPRTSQGGASCTELSFPQSKMLLVIRDRGEVSMKELAEALHVSAPSASTMVDRLVEMGMLLREQSRTDRRSVQVRISDQGRRAIDALESGILGSLMELMEKLGPDDAKTWRDLYVRIRGILEEDDAPSPVRKDVVA